MKCPLIFIFIFLSCNISIGQRNDYQYKNELDTVNNNSKDLKDRDPEQYWFEYYSYTSQRVIEVMNIGDEDVAVNLVVEAYTNLEQLDEKIVLQNGDFILSMLLNINDPIEIRNFKNYCSDIISSNHPEYNSFLPLLYEMEYCMAIMESNYIQAKEFAHKKHSYRKKNSLYANDLKSQFYDVMNLASNYRDLNNKDSSEYYFKEAEFLLRTHKSIEISERDFLDLEKLKFYGMFREYSDAERHVKYMTNKFLKRSKDKSLKKFHVLILSYVLSKGNLTENEITRLEKEILSMDYSYYQLKRGFVLGDYLIFFGHYVKAHLVTQDFYEVLPKAIEFYSQAVNENNTNLKLDALDFGVSLIDPMNLEVYEKEFHIDEVILAMEERFQSIPDSSRKRKLLKRLYFSLGSIYYEKAYSDNEYLAISEKYYLKSIQVSQSLESVDLFVYFQLALIARKNKDFKAANKFLLKQIEYYETSNHDYSFQTAVYLYWNGLNDKKIVNKHFNSAIKLNNYDDTQLRTSAVEFYKKKNNHVASKEYLEKDENELNLETLSGKMYKEEVVLYFDEIYYLEDSKLICFAISTDGMKVFDLGSNGWDYLKTKDFQHLTQLVYSKMKKELSSLSIISVILNREIPIVNLQLLQEKDNNIVVNYYFSFKDFAGKNYINTIRTSKMVLVGNPRFSLKAGSQSFEKFSFRGKQNVVNWVDLPSTGREITIISEIFKDSGYEIDTITEEDATEERFRMISNPEILHIATHGFSNLDGIAESGIILSYANDIDSINIDAINDGYFFSSDFNSINLAGTKLITLSACETGVYDSGTSNGFIYHLFANGAENIIVTTDKIDDDATRLFMTSFYQDLLVRENIDKALRAAIVQVKEKYPNKDYWSDILLLRKYRSNTIY